MRSGTFTAYFERSFLSGNLLRTTVRGTLSTTFFMSKGSARRMASSASFRMRSAPTTFAAAATSTVFVVRTLMELNVRSLAMGKYPSGSPSMIVRVKRSDRRLASEKKNRMRSATPSIVLSSDCSSAGAAFSAAGAASVFSAAGAASALSAAGAASAFSTAGAASTFSAADAASAFSAGSSTFIGSDDVSTAAISFASTVESCFSADIFGYW
mmetsp:Transcript_21531/g.48934  ORF Transcript_21531/g.48934 Transcript_21531/m.48934 type:complete len:212 (-) Transcript_21531:93-728(-)